MYYAQNGYLIRAIPPTYSGHLFQRYGEVEPLYKEALQLSEKLLSKEHPDTLTSIKDLVIL